MKTVKTVRAEKWTRAARIPLARVRWLQKLRRIAYLNQAGCVLD